MNKCQGWYDGVNTMWKAYTIPTYGWVQIFYLNSSTNLIFFDIVWKNVISNRETETTTSITLKTLNLDMMALIQWKILMVEFKN